MFGRKKNNFYRYMFQKSFMPLFAMLVVISMAFLIFFRITVVREKQKNRENDQRRLETCVSFTELQMKEIEKWGKQLLNGVELQKFVYMYDDLGRYSRFSLQNEIYESVYDLYYKNEQVDSVYSDNGKSDYGSSLSDISKAMDGGNGRGERSYLPVRKQ